MRCFPCAFDYNQTTTRLMESLYFLNITVSGRDPGKYLEILHSFQVENQLAPVSLIFFFISSFNSLNLVLIPGADFDGNWGTWIDCFN